MIAPAARTQGSCTPLFPRRPLVGVAMAFCAGVFAGGVTMFRMPAGWALVGVAGAFLLAAGVFLCSRRMALRTGMLYLCVFLCGWARADLEPVPDAPVARAGGVSDWRLGRSGSGRAAGGLDRFLQQARRSASGCLSTGVEDFTQSGEILQALLLGYRSRMSPEVREAFVATSTLHIFAISGSHVVVWAALVTAVCRGFRVSRIYWGAILVPLLAAYTLATGASASAVRACIMASVYFLGPWVHRKTDSLSTVAVAALLILAWNPGQLLDVGFQLSFVVVIGLIVLYGPLDRIFARPLQPDPLRLQPEPRARRWGRAALRTFASLVAASCAAWLVSTPLTVWFFGRFTPVGLIANLVVIPLSSAVMLCGALSVVLGTAVARILADVFNHAAVAVIWLMTVTTQWMAAIPGLSVQVPDVPAWSVALWYGVIGALALAWKCRPADLEKDGQGLEGME